MFIDVSFVAELGQVREHGVGGGIAESARAAGR